MLAAFLLGLIALFASPGTTRLGWQDDDRLHRVDLPDGRSVDYTYDAQGLMATRTSAEGTERYTWDGTLPYGQMIATTNGAGALQAREVWGTDHLAEIRNDTILWLLTDGLGHVRAVTDSVGHIIGRQDFDAWGSRTLDSGRTVRFGYRGEWSDPATGLVYLRARWMDPNSGRFVSEDPYEGDPNGPVSLHRYLYGNESPIHFFDPSGNMATFGEMNMGVVLLGILATMPAIRYTLDHGFLGSAISGWQIREAIENEFWREVGPGLGLISNGVDLSLLYPLGLALMWDHWRKFANSDEFARRVSQNPTARHSVDIWGPSLPKSPNKDRKIASVRFRHLDFSYYINGGGGRIFQIRYRIGQNAGPGQGYFLFRLDYMDYRAVAGGEWGPHYHLRYGGVNLDHESLF